MKHFLRMIVLGALVLNAGCVMFDLPSGKVKCFSEDLPANTLVVGRGFPQNLFSLLCGACVLARIAAVEESARDRDRERDLGKGEMLYILRNFQLNIFSY